MEKQKIEPNDPKNYRPIYVDKSGECVAILSDSFGEPDPYNMVVMSHDQFAKLTRTDLAQSLADALELFVENFEETRSEFNGKPLQIRNSTLQEAQAALANYRKGSE